MKLSLIMLVIFLLACALQIDKFANGYPQMMGKNMGNQGGDNGAPSGSNGQPSGSTGQPSGNNGQPSGNNGQP